MTLDELGCLARCNGATASTVRASAVAPDATEEALREAIRSTTAAARGPVLVASYARSALGQTGSGHFSPVAGYHPARDLALILDVARFKYPPHWAAICHLWRAMTVPDPATGSARGFEHRTLVATFLAQLRTTRVYRAVEQARSSPSSPTLSNEVLSVLLLALPPETISRLPAPVAAQLGVLRDGADTGPAVADEIEALRDQLTVLRQWTCIRRSTDCNPSW